MDDQGSPRRDPVLPRAAEDLGDPAILAVDPDRRFGSGASFTWTNRLIRLLWSLVWTLLARWTPGLMSPWRVLLLRLFGARISPHAAVAASARIWLPSNLDLGAGSTLGPGVDCYNMARIAIGERTIVSQRAFLCAGTHDFRDPKFQLCARPINIGSDVWIAAEAFVAPGVTIGDGAVLGARACAFDPLHGWTVYRGNPAVACKTRLWRGHDSARADAS
jgi:putative colanic acid biosynthesis acetyltransferase WcaF